MSTQTYARLSAALALHSHAIMAKGYQNQLFSLWAALETLLPLEAASSRIDRICEILLPVLGRQYPRKLLSALDADLRRCLPTAYEAALAALPERPESPHDCALIVCTTTHEPLRTELYRAATENPHLKFRLYSVHEALKSSPAIRSTIDSHLRRLRWHIRRIYRSRNLLAHKGQALPYRAALVENLHAYLDRLLSAIEASLGRSPAPRDIDEALLVVQLDYQAHSDYLTLAGASECTVDNYSPLLFGP